MVRVVGIKRVGRENLARVLARAFSWWPVICAASFTQVSSDEFLCRPERMSGWQSAATPLVADPSSRHKLASVVLSNQFKLRCGRVKAYSNTCTLTTTILS